MTDLVSRSDVSLRPDPGRVVARLFIPGHEGFVGRESRTAGVLTRVLGLDDEDAETSMRRLQTRFAGRHRDLPGVIRRHYEQVSHRVPASVMPTRDRVDLVGATFTNEFAIEGAALFNPSAVPHPDQSGLEAGQCRFVLSLRAVGEGHRSCIEFRTGVLGPGRTLRLDDPGPHAELGYPEAAPMERSLFAALLVEAGADADRAEDLIGLLPQRFDRVGLDAVLSGGDARWVMSRTGVRTADLARRVVACTYVVRFPVETSLAERVLWPYAPTESAGMEDARFVRVTGDDASVTYRGTYTAYDGARIAPQLIETTDFREFRVSQLAGPAAKDKGLALFPRRVGGRHAMLSRSDRETIGIAWSDDGFLWGVPEHLYGPCRAWDVIQTGNCGSPIETRSGWVVLTHGVGPMREYVIGALLLDLDDPGRVVGALREPLLSAGADERDGYVPNVVYSCGALRHGDLLLLPYGASDDSVRFAFVDVPGLVERLLSDGPPPATAANRSA